MILNAHESIVSTVRELLSVARYTLQQWGCHLPTSVLHTMNGTVPIVLPFKNNEQKKALVEYVKKQALSSFSFAVTTITAAKVVDSRTGGEQECLVLATSIQGGKLHVLVQYFSRGDDGIITFGEIIEGDEAIMPGQMVIYPDWAEETSH